MTIAVDAVYEAGVLRLKGALDLPDNTEVHVTIETLPTEAHTALGGQLRALRATILTEGADPLGWEGIQDEVARRRGGWRDTP